MTCRAVRNTPVIEGVDDGFTVFAWVVMVLSVGFAGQAVSDPVLEPVVPGLIRR